jgi:uncharacterized protein
MPATVVPIDIRAVVPTSGGTAIFLGNADKVFLVYIDNAVGAAIAMFLGKVPRERPQTHDLMATLLTALGAKVERVVINDVQQDTFYARLLVSVENEVQEKKLVELDARPSDCLALALRAGAPVFAARKVWEKVEDMSDLLRTMQEQGQAANDDDQDDAENEGPPEP